MTQPSPPPALADARAALDLGLTVQARTLALSVLQAAESAADLPSQARALLVMADCDRAASKIRGAASLAQRAAQAFRLLQDVAGEVEALVLLGHCTSMLGRAEESVESALLAVRLLDQPTADPGLQISAHRYLGLAHCLSLNFERADEALDEAIRLAEVTARPAAIFEPRANKLYTAIMRVVTQRFAVGQRPGVAAVSARHAECRPPDWADGGAVVGNKVIARALWALMSSIEAAWTGNFVQAEAQLAEGHTWAESYGSLGRMNATEAWARTELAWARGRLEQAARHAADMVRIASLVEHQQLACTGHLLLAQLFEQQGLLEHALAEIRLLRQREHHIRLESLESRARVVAWELQTRRSETVVQQLRSASAQLERLSLEDELTGIANRRCFERALGEQMASGQGPGEREGLWIAYLDVDGFKQINDRFSHAVGDRVLARIGSLLRDSVRQADLPARLGGDEFVVMFVGVREPVARQACERIAMAIESHDWHAIAPGLQVKASLGLARAEAGDTLQDVVHRSDSAMYALKKRGRTTAGAMPPQPPGSRASAQ